MLIMLEGNYFPFEKAIKPAVGMDTAPIASVGQLYFIREDLFSMFTLSNTFV